MPAIIVCYILIYICNIGISVRKYVNWVCKYCR